MRRNRRLNPYAWEMYSLLGLISLYFIDREFLESDYAEYVNIIGPSWCAWILGYGAWRRIKEDIDHMWTALWWFRIASCIYLCFGCLVAVLGDSQMIEYLQGLYKFKAIEIEKLNFIIACSLFIFFFSSELFLRAFAPDLGEAGNHDKFDSRFDSNMFIIGLIFLVIGAICRVAFVFPYEMGWAVTPVPGFITSLSNSTQVAIYLLTLWSLKSSPGFLPVVFAIMGLEMGLGLLLFNKSSVLFPLMVFSIGWLHVGATKKKVIVIVSMFAFSFAVLQPWAAYARIRHGSIFGGTGGSTLGERLDILQSYFDENSSMAESTSSQHTLIRFSIVNTGTFVINRFDRGFPGNSLENALVIFIPRIIWPDKPIYTPGADLAFLAANQVGNSISAGLFAESYWLFGWWGLPILVIPLAVVLTIASIYALSVLRNGQWVHIPALLYALKMGTRVDGSYVIDVIGGSVTLFGMFVVSWLLAAALGMNARPQYRQGRA